MRSLIALVAAAVGLTVLAPAAPAATASAAVVDRGFMWQDGHAPGPITPLVSGMAGFVPSDLIVAGPQLTSGRQRVTDTTTYPNSAVVKLTFAVGADKGNCTGFMVAPNLVATAAHCVYDKATNSFYNFAGYKAVPGQDVDAAGTKKQPFGFCGAANLGVARPYVANPGPDQDYGVVVLDCNIGNRTGWFGLISSAAPGYGSIVGRRTDQRGYPEGAGDLVKNEMYSGQDQVRTTVGSESFFTNIQVRGGDSGSPIWDSTDLPSPCTQSPLIKGACAFGITSKMTSDGMTARVKRVTLRVVADFIDAGAIPL